MKVRKRALGPGWRKLGLLGLLSSACLSAMGPATAVEPGPIAAENKAPELWTLEERLEARFDPEQQKQRKERLRAERAALGRPDLKASEPSAQEVGHISGALEPELYMPSELFNILIRSGFHVDPDRRSGFRARIMNRARALGFDESLWTSLEGISRELIQHNQEVSRYLERFNRRLAEASPAQREALMEEARKKKDGETELGFELCRQRFEALAAARLRFGAERFDRLLYQAVAPPLLSTSTATAEEIRFVEEGCQ